MAARPLVLGHRGASRVAPENTIEAFTRARDMGADGVELDVHRTADDVLVVFHDADVPDFGLIVERRFDELRVARPDVPTLADALAACAGMLVNVEIKCCPWDRDPDTPERRVVHAVVEIIRAQTTPVIVSSFDLGAVDACRAIAPELTTAWLTHGQSLVAAGARTADHGHQWLHPDRASALAASPADIAAVHGRGLMIDVWTVDDPADMQALVGAGIDGIITNVPDVALAALGRSATA